MASDSHLMLPAYLFNPRADFQKKKPPKLKKPPKPAPVLSMVFSVHQMGTPERYRNFPWLSRHFYEIPSRRQRVTFTRIQSLARVPGLSLRYAS